MGLYNFQPRFVEPILSGRKRQTIRAPRKHPDRPGNTLHLYTGLRHPGARLLARPVCTAVERIVILQSGDVSIGGGFWLDRFELELLALRDGFASHSEMFMFWRAAGRLPFEGQIIFWAQETT
jgi:hypothetical protein